MDELVRRVVDDTSGSLARRLGRALRTLARRVTHRPPAEVTVTAAVPPLSHAQLLGVRRRVLELAPKYYLTPEDAEALADRVVAQLILATAAPGSGSQPSAGAGTDPVQ